jgi:hypothetical protein
VWGGALSPDKPPMPGLESMATPGQERARSQRER